MTTTVTSYEVQDLLIAQMTGAGMAANLDSLRTKYSVAHKDLRPINKADVYKYETLESNRFPYLIVTYDSGAWAQAGSKNVVTEDFIYRIIFGVEYKGTDKNKLEGLIQLYLDAASRIVANIYEAGNPAVIDGRPIRKTMGAGFTTDNGIMKFATLECQIKAYTTTELI